MAITVASVLARVRNQLNDAGSRKRWTDTELLDYANEGQRSACVLKPDLMAVEADVTPSAGSRQSMPADGFQMLDVICNIDPNTGEELSGIRVCARTALDSLNPDWRMQKYAKTTVLNYYFEGTQPKVYSINPPQPTGTTAKIRISYAKTPDLLTLDGVISLPDVLDQCLVDYVLFRAFAKDTEADGNTERATAAYQRFAAAVGAKETTERRDDPNQGMTGFTAPTNPAGNK